MVTNAGGGSSRWKDLAVTRWREDSTCDNWGTFCYIRDVASGEFWSTAHQPTLQARRRATRRSSPRRAPNSAAATTDFETHTEIVVSPEDDIELRRLRITNRSRTRADDRGHELRRSRRSRRRPRTRCIRRSPTSSCRPRSSPQRQAILCTRRPRSRDEQAPWMFHLMAVHGAGVARTSPTRPTAWRFIGRGRTRRRAAGDDAMPGGSSGSAGLGARSDRRDPASDHARAASRPRRSTSSSGIGRDARRRAGLVDKYQDRHLADRVFDLAWTHSQVMLRQINATEADAQLYARLASSVIYANAVAARRGRRARCATAAGSRACGATRSPATCRSCCCRSATRRTSTSCASWCRRTRTGA